MSSSTDPFGNQTRYTYNGRGLQTEIIDGKGNTTTIFKNSLNGEIEFQSNPLGEKTLYSHDEFGRQIQIVGVAMQLFKDIGQYMEVRGVAGQPVKAYVKAPGETVKVLPGAFILPGE